MSVRNAVRAAVALAALAAAGAASAFEFHGYFRDSMAVNSKGGTQVCFQLPGSDFKARLGNECDRYLEMSFSETGKLAGDAVQWKYEFMPASYLPSVDQTATNSVFVQQSWGGLTIKDWDGATIWVGRRYYRRHDVHSLDWFYWNPGQGNATVGIDDVNIHFGKMAFNVFRMDATTLAPPTTTGLSKGVYVVPEIRAYSMPVNTNGTLEVGIDLAIAHDQGQAIGAGRAGTSPLFTVQHNQDKLFGGSNTLVFQYGSGAFFKESGDGPGQILAAGTTSDKQWRIIEHLVFNPTPDWSGALVLVYQDQTRSGGGARIFTGELRPAYQFVDYFKLAVDAFYQSLDSKESGVATATLLKLTIAPTFVLGRGYWARPEIRIFATYGSWNDGAVALAGASPMASGAFGTAKSGWTFGSSIEAWF